MMGERRVRQDALFYAFSLEDHVPDRHLLRSIDRFVELDGLRQELAPFYSEMGRPSIDPELLIRMLIVGYCFGIRSERRLCEEVHLNLAYRWFCGLGLDGEVPDHSTFSKNRHGRFRDSDLLRRLFETVLQRCIDEGLVGGEGFAVDASLIAADASDRTRVEGAAGLPPDAASRAVEEYLAVLDDAVFGAATEVTPKFIAPADPATRWTAAHRGPAFFAYSANYLIDTDNAIIVDVEATTAIRQAEVLAAKRMVERSLEGFDFYPAKLIGGTAYGTAEMLNWLVNEHGIEPHIPVFDKSQRTDGTFSRDDFAYDHKRDCYICPAGKQLRHRHKIYRMTVEPGHLGAGAGLVDKDELVGIDEGLRRPPDAAPGGNIRPVLLGGAERLFLNDKPRRSTADHIAPLLNCTACSAARGHLLRRGQFARPVTAPRAG